MDALQQSNLWSIGAHFTQLFDWDAVGAVLVFVTLLQAIWLAGSSARRFEAQQSVVLRYVRSKLISLNTIETISAGALKSGVELQELSSLPLIAELEESFSVIDPMSLPTSASMEAVERSRNSLLTLRGLYDPDSDDRDLFKALIPFTADYTRYAIKLIEREIEDRNPVFVVRLFRQVTRGPAPSRPQTLLGKAMEKGQTSPLEGTT